MWFNGLLKEASKVKSLHLIQQIRLSTLPKPVRRRYGKPSIIQKAKELEFSDLFTSSHIPNSNDNPELNDFLPTLERRESSLEEVLDEEISFPIKLLGIEHEIEEKATFVCDQMFINNHISKAFVLDHLEKIFHGYIMALIYNDTEYFSEYVESQFAERSLNAMSEIKTKGYQIGAYFNETWTPEQTTTKLIPENSFFAKSFSKRTSKILDAVLVRGLSWNREENGQITDYHRFTDDEDMGLMVFSPLSWSNPENFVNPTQNKEMYSEEQKSVLRLLLEIKSPVEFKVEMSNNSPLDLTDNTYLHLAVFETDLEKPPHLKSFSKLETYLEWLTKFKIGKWKIVDVDNYMMGNPLIVETSERKQFLEKVFKGSRFDPRMYIDLKKI